MECWRNYLNACSFFQSEETIYLIVILSECHVHIWKLVHWDRVATHQELFTWTWNIIIDDPTSKTKTRLDVCQHTLSHFTGKKLKCCVFSRGQVAISETTAPPGGLTSITGIDSNVPEFTKIDFFGYQTTKMKRYSIHSTIQLLCFYFISY